VKDGIYQFIVTVVKRDDCEQPRNELEAAQMVTFLLEQGSFLDVLDLRRAQPLVNS
jgi:hypothetical protein